MYVQSINLYVIMIPLCIHLKYALPLNYTDV